MSGSISFQYPRISFCPSTVSELFSVRHNGKTHELTTAQKVGIIFTAVIGIALAGVGVLLGYWVSYSLRERLVKQLTTEQVDNARAKINELRGKYPDTSSINGQTLQQMSKQDRHFINIGPGNFNLKISGFSPLSLPKGIYCVYNPTSCRLEELYDHKYNDVMKAAFGCNNLNHLLVCYQVTKPSCLQIHSHQLALCTDNAAINVAIIAQFKKHLKLSS